MLRLMSRRSCSIALALALGAPAAHANLILNGSFETGPAPGAALQLPAGSTAISSWVVTRTSVDYVGTAWAAASGGCSVGLNGADAGGIAQTFATTMHAQYTVRFYLAGDTGTQPVVTQMRVSTGSASQDFSYDNSGMWAWDPGWNWHAWTFTAPGPNTTLEFYSLQSGPTGPGIDSVTVELTSLAGVVPETPAAFALAPVVPNPSRGARELDFAVARAARVRLAIADVAGREVAVLRDAAFEPGRYTATWDGRASDGLARPGLYLATLSGGGERHVQRMIVLQ